MEVGQQFHYGALVDGYRCRSTEWLLASRAEAVREQRRWRVEELALTAALDERGAFDETLAAADGVSTRTVRETVETAHALEALPQVAAAAHDGALSDEQLVPLAQLADAASDAEWARRGRDCAPADLARLARTQEKPTAEDAHRRRAARELAMWWRRDAGMLAFRGELPDLDGALFESVINEMIERMRPPGVNPGTAGRIAVRTRWWSCAATTPTSRRSALRKCISSCRSPWKARPRSRASPYLIRWSSRCARTRMSKRCSSAGIKSR
jgi:hypothetical protein